MVDAGIVLVLGSTGRHRADCQPDSRRNSADALLASAGNRTDTCPGHRRAQDQVVRGAAGKVGWALRQSPTALAGLARLHASDSGTAEMDEVEIQPAGVKRRS